MDNLLIANQPLSRPKVLFLGNGILRAYSKDAKACGDLEQQIYEKLKIDSSLRIGRPTIPFPMRIAATLANAKVVSNGIQDAVAELIFGPNSDAQTTNELLCNSEVVKSSPLVGLLKAGFTDVITTNYGYEIEKVIGGRCPTADTKRKDFYRYYNFPKDKNIRERKYKLRRFYRFPETGTRIWHIHGEYLRPHSIIFEYCDYCSFLAKIKERKSSKRIINVQSVEPSPEEYSKRDGLWIDAFTWGDVYILGFSASLGESEFWWAMERRRRKQTQTGQTGTVYFYEPKFEDSNQDRYQQDVLAMMTAFGGKYRNMDVTITKDSQFKEFYEKACKDIIAEVKGLARSANSSERK